MGNAPETADCLAHFITFRTYGTWLPGDRRGTVDKHHNVPGTPYLAPNGALERWAESQLKNPPFVLDDRARSAVDSSIRETCRVRGWILCALNVRTNHVHVVVRAAELPERVMTALKAYGTRDLRRANLIRQDQRVWAGHGSTRKLMTEDAIRNTSLYVIEGQGKEMGTSGEEMFF